MENTGEVLERYLKSRMSKTDLAGILGISPQYISRVMNNLKRPSKNFLEKFYMIFNVNEEDKAKIEEYEKFRRLPDEFQKELLNLKGEMGETTKTEFLKIPLKAIVESELGYLTSAENDEFILTPKSGYVNEKSFFIRIYSNELEPDFKNKDLVLIDPGSCMDFYLLNGKICVFEYNNELLLRKMEYLKEIIILRCINEKLNPLIIGESNIQSLKCVGRVRQITRYVE